MSDDSRNRDGDAPDGAAGEFNLFSEDGQVLGAATDGAGDTAEDAPADEAPAADAPRRGRRRRAQAAGDAAGDAEMLPARVHRGRAKGKGRRGTALPALRPADPNTPAIRAERVDAIRRDLVRRRRRKGLGVIARLLVFVMLPTAFVAWFLWTKASDLYRTETVFVVQSADLGGSSSGGGLFAAFGGGVTDAVAVQNFILSREVLKLLDDEMGLIARYQDPALDWFHRLDADASFEAAFDSYKRFTEVAFDPTEGVLTLRVVASDPEYARDMTRAILDYAEQMVDTLSDPIRENALANAETNLTGAEERLRDAQLQAADLRKELETFSVEGQFSAEMNIITQLEIELEGLKARLTNLRRVTGEDDPRVQRLSSEVETLEAQVAARRARVTGSGGERASLADVNAQIERANFEVTAAMALFTSAIEAREIARAESQRQHRYLSVVVVPALPDAPNYPQKPEMTALAFLIFLGIYIMSSLTISLVREQASI